MSSASEEKSEGCGPPKPPGDFIDSLERENFILLFCIHAACLAELFHQRIQLFGQLVLLFGAAA